MASMLDRDAYDKGSTVIAPEGGQGDRDQICVYRSSDALSR